MALIDIDIDDLHAILVYKINDIFPIDIKLNKIVEYNIYNDVNIHHIICNLRDVPHLKYIQNKKMPYVNYMVTAGHFSGYGIEHSFENFDNLIKNFNYSNDIKCKRMFGKIVIVDGVHRAAILKSKNVKKITCLIV